MPGRLPLECQLLSSVSVFNFLILPKYSRSSYYRPQPKLRQDNVFTPVCDSVHREGGSLSGRPPPGQRPPPTPPPLDRDSRTVTSRRYAFYWNAFLFLKRTLKHFFTVYLFALYVTCFHLCTFVITIRSLK